MKKKSVNCGSAIIEMTLLIPILLGIIYLYIMLFLFLIESAAYKEIMVETLYSLQEEQNDEFAVDSKEEIVDGYVTKRKKGTQISVFVDKQVEKFDIELEMHRNGDSIVKNIRRWQLAADTLRTGENE